MSFWHFFSGWDWTAIGIGATPALAIVGGIWAWIRQKKPHLWFTDRKTLLKTIFKQRQKITNLEQEAVEVQASWKLARDVGQFSRDEANELIKRVTHLETMVPKLNAAISYIKILLAHFNYLNSWATRNKVELPQIKVPVPPEILEEIVYERNEGQ